MAVSAARSARGFPAHRPTPRLPYCLRSPGAHRLREGRAHRPSDLPGQLGPGPARIAPWHAEAKADSTTLTGVQASRAAVRQHAGYVRCSPHADAWRLSAGLASVFILVCVSWNAAPEIPRTVKHPPTAL